MTFQTTRWSLILRAQLPGAEGHAAFGELCAAYQAPVYTFFRRHGANQDRAAELTQGLFTDLLERDSLRTADPQRGRFRAFLKTCARHWWSNERDRAAARRRGGGRRPLAIDTDALETWLQDVAVDHLDADALFERRWAQTVIDRALWQLEQDELAAGRQTLFAELKPVLDGTQPREPWAVLADRLGTTEGALRVAAHRLRVRCRELLIAEVRDTLPDDHDPGHELQELLAALQAGAPGRNSGESR
ncbi:MAG: sigma-70 family RNA polymerase sigma factor [Planctomycetes bacterium]|nr:sigma-70 family RNA polymerase sigma factor [Planctomycetota bacterium]